MAHVIKDFGIKGDAVKADLYACLDTVQIVRAQAFEHGLGAVKAFEFRASFYGHVIDQGAVGQAVAHPQIQAALTEAEAAQLLPLLNRIAARALTQQGYTVESDDAVADRGFAATRYGDEAAAVFAPPQIPPRPDAPAGGA